MENLGEPSEAQEPVSRRKPTPYVEARGVVHERMAGLAHLQLDNINATGGCPETRWTVQDLGSERWLVSARDAEPWLDLNPTAYAH